MANFLSKIFLVLILIVAGCTGTTRSTKTTQIYVNYKEILTLPDKYNAGDTGKVIPVKAGEESKISGLIFPTKKAMEYAKLMVKYDELYNVASINNKLAIATVDIANKKINEADSEINKLREKQDSWWNRNKVTIGVLGGFTIGVTLSGVIVWGAFKISNK